MKTNILCFLLTVGFYGINFFSPIQISKKWQNPGSTANTLPSISGEDRLHRHRQDGKRWESSHPFPTSPLWQSQSVLTPSPSPLGGEPRSLQELGRKWEMLGRRERELPRNWSLKVPKNVSMNMVPDVPLDLWLLIFANCRLDIWENIVPHAPHFNLRIFVHIRLLGLEVF